MKTPNNNDTIRKNRRDEGEIWVDTDQKIMEALECVMKKLNKIETVQREEGFIKKKER